MRHAGVYRVLSTMLAISWILSLVQPTIARAAPAAVPPASPLTNNTTTAPQADYINPNGIYISERFAPVDTSGIAPAGPIGESDRRPVARPMTLELPGANGVTPAGWIDPALQAPILDLTMPEPLLNFEGIPATGVFPPDTDGQIGKTQYVQVVNSGAYGTAVRVWDKNSGDMQYDFGMNPMWPTGDACNTSGYGDPVVLWDQLAERWLLTQFTIPPGLPYYLCVAVSKTETATNDPSDWWLYSLPADDANFPDYPKWGIWPDGYYMSANQFVNLASWGGAGVYAYDRAAMLNGEPTAFQYYNLGEENLNYGGLLPTNLMGDTLPPVGAPNYYMSVDMDWSGSDDIMHVWEFHADWADPNQSSFTLVNDLVVAPFDWNFSAPSGAEVPQPDTSQGLDDLADRLMMHLWYRNYGTHESLVVNHTVDAGSDLHGIRWYEIRGGTVNTTLADAEIYQQSTFAPDSEHRWMGSIAMDHVGNMALGYSISSETMYPSIRYTGRLSSDPLGEMSQGEAIMMVGSGSQTGSDPYGRGRWGDYSAMSVDPEDDCTFWYTQEYIETTGPANWQTRVASFKFPNCSKGPQGILNGLVTDGLNPLEDIVIAASSSPTLTFSTMTDPSGNYSIALPIGTYDVTASGFGYLPETVTEVEILTDTVVTQDFTLVAAPTHLLEGTVTDGLTGWPLYARVSLPGVPVDPVWTDPETGFYSLVLPEGYDYSLVAQAFVTGYQPGEIQVGYLTADTVVDIALAADLVACTAPGYEMNLTEVFFENFESGFSNWTMTGLWNEEQETDTCGSYVAPFPSPTHAAYFGDSSCDFDTGSTVTGELTSPAISLPATDAAFLSIASYEQTECNGACSWDKRYIEVSGDNGASWEILGEGDTELEWYTKSLNLSEFSGQDVQVRFRFDSLDNISNWFFGWMVDNVQLHSGTCTPTAGGLVVGSVTDENTGLGLAGALITSLEGYSTESQATPEDPSEPEGFYTLFAPTGGNTLTVSKRGGYAEVSAVVGVPEGTTVRRDFALPAGWLLSDTSALSAELELGQTQVDEVLLSNAGSVPLEYEISENDRGWIPLYRGPGAQLALRVSDYYSPYRLGIDPHAATEPLKPLPSQMPPWTPIADYPTMIMDNVAAYFDGKIYSVGGYDGISNTNKGYVYDPESNAWSEIASMSEIREKPAAAFIDGLLYVAGGWSDTGEPVATLEIYDPASDSWSTGAPNPMPLAASTGVALDGKFYVIGGCDMFSCGYDQVMVYDPASDSWSSAGIYPEPISWNACGVIDGLMYCAGGVSDLNGETTGTYVYDPATDTWTALASMPQTAWGAGFIAANGYLFVSGGVTNNFSTVTNQTFAYDPISDTWVEDANSNNVLYRGASACGFYRIGGSLGGFSPSPASELYPGLEDCGEAPKDLPWISTSPITGTLPGGTDQVVDVTFDATQSGAVQPGSYYGQLKIKNDTPYGSLSIPVTMTVSAPPTWGKVYGVVTGLGYCDLNPGPLSNATVVIQGTSNTYTTTTDNGGYYQWWLDSAESPLTIQVYADGHVMSEVTGLALAAQDQVLQDFELRWEQPCLVPSQTSLAATLYLGASTTRGLRLTNHGAGEAAFEMTDYAIPDTNLPEGAAAIPGTLVPFDGNRIELSTAGQGALSPNAGSAPYAPAGDIDLILDDGSAEDSIGLGFGGQFIWLNRFTPDPTQYPFLLDQVSLLVSPWTNQGADLQLVIYQDADSDPTNGADLLYTEWVTVEYNDNYTWNTYTLASPVFIGGPGGDVLVGVVNRSGAAGVWDYPASVDFSSPSQQRSWIGLYAGDPPDPPVLPPDIDFALIDDFGLAGNWTLRASGVTLPDAAWLTEIPDFGTVPADTYFNTTILFDANQVPTPGLYNGAIKIESNDPVNPARTVPVRLQVNAPASWGELNGMITSLGYCDANPENMNGALIEAESASHTFRQAYSDADGHYSLWLDSLSSPYTVTFSVADHLPVTIGGVMVGAGGAVTTQNADLRSIQPCLSYTPELFDVSVNWHESMTETLVFENTGAGEGSIALKERVGGFLPLAPGDPAILVVNDWGMETSATQAITQSLQTLGYAYTVVNSAADTGIPATLSDYQLVIYAGFPDSGTEENALKAYLDQGGSLLIAYSNLGEYNWISVLYEEYLQAYFYTGNGSRGEVVGEDIMKGLTIDISSDLSPDDFFIGPDAVGIFMRDGNIAWAGSRIEREDYRAIYLAWNFDNTGGPAIGDPDESILMQKAITWLVPPADALTWLTATPLTATLPADTGVVNISVNFNAGDAAITQPGTYYGNLQVTTDDGGLGKFMLPVTMNVAPPPGWGRLSGLIFSQGYCDQENNPLPEATIQIEDNLGGMYELSSNDLGNYIYWLDEALEPYTITVSADHHLPTQVVTGVTAGENTALDIGLRWAEPCVSLVTTEISVTLGLSSTTTAPFTFGNTGAVSTTWSLVEELAGFTPLLPTGGGPLVYEENFEGDFPPTGWNVTDEAGTGNVWNRNDLLGAPNRTLDAGGSGYSAAADSDAACNGMAWDTTLYSPILDMSNFGALRLVYRSNFWNFRGYGEIWLDISADGGATWDNLRHEFISNPPEGTTEFEDLSAYDYSAIQLRWRYSDNGNGCAWFWHIDDVMILGLPEVDWLSEDHRTGVLDADTGSDTVTLTLDANLVDQPGTYSAYLHLLSEDPYGSDWIAPITMNVTPPATWGKVTGTVTSLGYCDANPTPLANALVSITTSAGGQAEVYTDENGVYTWWTDEAAAPLDITISDPLHNSQTLLEVPLTAGETTTRDVELRLLASCTSASPTSLEVTLTTGMSETLPLTLANTGLVDTFFEFAENLGGFVPFETLRTGKALENSPLPGAQVGSLAQTVGEIFTPTPIHTPNAEEYYITQSLSQDIIVGNSVACNNGFETVNNSYLRVFNLADYGITSEIRANMVQFGIETAISPMGSQSVFINLYALEGDLLWENMTLLGSVQTDIADSMVTLAEIPVDVIIPANTVLVVEIFSPAAGNFFFVGSNSAGQTGFTYLSSVDCSVPEPIPTDDIGFPNMHLVMNILAETTLVEIPWLSESPITGTVSFGDDVESLVTFTASEDLAVGVYTGTLLVFTADPTGEALLIPVSMTVGRYDLAVEADLTEQNGAPEETLVYELSVTNTGVGISDSYHLTLDGNQFVTWASETTVGPLDPGESATVTVMVEIPEDAPEGSADTVTVTLTSAGDGSVSQQVMLTTHVLFDMMFEAEEYEQTGAANEVLVYNLTVTNQSTAASASYQLDLEGNRFTTWASQTSIGPLDPGESATIQVMVQLPVHAVENDFDQVVVTLTLSGNPLISKQITLTSHVTSPFRRILYLPIINHTNH